jgi:chemotaxis protein methyltransferase CheR
LSAACATGEEPYSIAIVVHELRDELPRPIEIVGIDVNPLVIERAREARYSRWSLRGVPEERSTRWFAEDGRDLRLDERIRRMVTFEERNLLDDGGAWLVRESYDVIFCRNLLMYFTPEAMSRVVDRLTQALVPGGFLFLGHAETLRGLTRNFHLHHTHETFYYERKRAEEVEQMSTSIPAASVVGPLLAAEVEHAESWVEAISRASERVRKLVDRSLAGAALPRFVAGERPQHDLSAVIELVRKERYEDALSIVDALPHDSLRNPDVLTLRAVLLVHRGDLLHAEEVCRTLLIVDELNAGAHYLMALCREGALDRSAAIDHDQTAIYLDPGFAAPRLHLGLLERKRGRRFEAGNHLTRALVLLEREDPSRLLFFGGGFSREALIAFCRAELLACGGTP